MAAQVETTSKASRPSVAAQNPRKRAEPPKTFSRQEKSLTNQKKSEPAQAASTLQKSPQQAKKMIQPAAAVSRRDKSPQQPKTRKSDSTKAASTFKKLSPQPACATDPPQEASRQVKPEKPKEPKKARQKTGKPAGVARKAFKAASKASANGKSDASSEMETQPAPSASESLQSTSKPPHGPLMSAPTLSHTLIPNLTAMPRCSAFAPVARSVGAVPPSMRRCLPLGSAVPMQSAVLMPDGQPAILPSGSGLVPLYMLPNLGYSQGYPYAQAQRILFHQGDSSSQPCVVSAGRQLGQEGCTMLSAVSTEGMPVATVVRTAHSIGPELEPIADDSTSKVQLHMPPPLIRLAAADAPRCRSPSGCDLSGVLDAPRMGEKKSAFHPAKLAAEGSAAAAMEAGIAAGIAAFAANMTNEGIE